MRTTTCKKVVAVAAALTLYPFMPAPAEAQSRTSGVRISRGHVYVGGQHVGAIGATAGRTGLSRIVNPAVGRLGPGFRRPPDVRAGGFGSRDRFGGGRFFDPFDRRFRDRARLPHRRSPRVGANGILLGGEIPLFLPFSCTACRLGLHPFVSGFPLFPLFSVVQVETRTLGGTTAVIPWPVVRAPERTRLGAPGPRIGRLVLEVPEPEPRKQWEGPCVGVRVRMATGTMQWLRVPLRSLGADSPRAAQELLEERVEEGRPLRLTGFSGGGLTVPAGLVKSIEVEACPSESP